MGWEIYDGRTLIDKSKDGEFPEDLKNLPKIVLDLNKPWQEYLKEKSDKLHTSK